MGFEGMEGVDGREACAREGGDGHNSWVVKPAPDVIDGSGLCHIRDPSCPLFPCPNARHDVLLLSFSPFSFLPVSPPLPPSLSLGQSAGSTSGKPAPGTTNSLFERARSNPTPRTESRSGKRKAIAGFVAGALGAVHRGLDNSPAQTVLQYVGMSSSAPTTPAAAPTPSRSPPALGLQRVCSETLISPSVGDLDAVVFVAWSAGNQFVGADARERGREDKDSVLLAVRQSGRIVMCDIDMKSGRARARDREHKHGAKTDFPFTVSPVR